MARIRIRKGKKALPMDLWQCNTRERLEDGIKTVAVFCGQRRVREL